jgi:hypothetical protein
MMTFLRIVIPTLSFCLSMIFFGKPVPTFPDHALFGGVYRSRKRPRCGDRKPPGAAQVIDVACLR